MYEQLLYYPRRGPLQRVHRTAVAAGKPATQQLGNYGAQQVCTLRSLTSSIGITRAPPTVPLPVLNPAPGRVIDTSNSFTCASHRHQKTVHHTWSCKPRHQRMHTAVRDSRGRKPSEQSHRQVWHLSQLQIIYFRKTRTRSIIIERQLGKKGQVLTLKSSTRVGSTTWWKR